MSASESISASASLRVLALHAHPDDLEFQCAGTLALLKERGCQIIMATMTPGDCGSAEHDAEAISAIRRSEAQESARKIDAQCFCLEFRDLTIFDNDDSRRRVTEFLRKVRPDLVLTAPPIDYLCDHEATSRLVRDACFTAPIPNYLTQRWDPSPPLHKIPYLYFVDPIEGVDRDGSPQAADFYVDVSSSFEVKREMLACHASQRNWLLRQHGIDEYLESQAAWSRKRGAEVGVEHAEAFRQYLGHAYPRENLLLSILGQNGQGGKD